MTIDFGDKILERWQERHQVREYRVVGKGTPREPRILELVTATPVSRGTSNTLRLFYDKVNIKYSERSPGSPVVTLNLRRREREVPVAYGWDKSEVTEIETAEIGLPKGLRLLEPATQ